MSGSDEDLMRELAAETAALPETPADEDALTAARRMAEEVNTLDARIEKGQALLLTLSERRNQILGTDLVRLMDDNKIESIKVDGREFSTNSYYKAALPKEDPKPGIDWLE